MEPKGSLPGSKEPATAPYPEPDEYSPRPCAPFRNKMVVCGERFLVPFEPSGCSP